MYFVILCWKYHQPCSAETSFLKLTRIVHVTTEGLQLWSYAQCTAPWILKLPVKTYPGNVLSKWLTPDILSPLHARKILWQASSKVMLENCVIKLQEGIAIKTLQCFREVYDFVLGHVHSHPGSHVNYYCSLFHFKNSQSASQHQTIRWTHKN